MIEQLSDESREDIRLLLDEGRVVRQKHNDRLEVYLREDEAIASPTYDGDILLMETFDDHSGSEFVGKMVLELDTTGGEDESDTEQEND